MSKLTADRHLVGAVFALIVAGLMTSGQTAKAEDLTIGMAGDVTSMDPHFHAVVSNIQVVRHIFDTLVQMDPEGQLIPGLAVAWGPTDDPTIWEFDLRQGVTFHDSTPFTADDVAFSLGRAGDVPNSPSGFGAYTAGITQIEIVDDHTVRLHTETPLPSVADDLSNVAIVSRTHGVGATTAQYNTGEVAIGTGPYRYESFVPGDRVEVTANPDYWGGTPAWDRVTFLPITRPSSRLAALLSGSVDVIERVPTMDVDRLSENPNVTLSQGVSNRLIYLHLDSDREQSPMVTALDGSAIDNPLRDSRVREALSLVIDREAITEHVMEGIAVPAGQLVPDGVLGVSEAIVVPRYDPDRARALLEEAGYGDGFAIKLHGPSDRYINDAQILQAVAQMFSRIGLKVEVDAMPSASYFGRASNLEFSVVLVGWGSLSGDASSPLRSLIATYTPERGWGASNRGRYSNAAVDTLLDQALQTLDIERRQALLAEATEIAMDDTALIPVHFQVNTWATRPDLQYIPRLDEFMVADGVVAAH
jgi:peptide/nickel transport system substrate-binding protein